AVASELRAVLFNEGAEGRGITRVARVAYGPDESNLQVHVRLFAELLEEEIGELLRGHDLKGIGGDAPEPFVLRRIGKNLREALCIAGRHLGAQAIQYRQGIKAARVNSGNAAGAELRQEGIYVRLRPEPRPGCGTGHGGI